MGKIIALTILLALGVYFGFRINQYRHADKVDAKIIRYQKERGLRRAPDMFIAYVGYRFNGQDYDERLGDSWLFEYEDTGHKVTLVLDTKHPEEAIANGVMTYWFPVEAWLAFLFGGTTFGCALFFIRQLRRDRAFAENDAGRFRYLKWKKAERITGRRSVRRNGS